MPPAKAAAPELILHNGRITTLDRSNPDATAVAIADGRFVAIGSDKDMMALGNSQARRIDLDRRRVIPGLIDNHLHIIRGGLNYNMELRWDGVPSLADAMRMLKAQAQRTPAPQWVRVVGGFTEHQFAEKRLPTLDEINAAAPDTPVFILHLYDRALLNRAALRACGYTKDTPEPAGGTIQRDAGGEPTGLLLAKPNAMILYATLAKGPKLPLEYQMNSTRHFMRELNRLGVTGAIDAGGGFQNYPDDYEVIEKLAASGELTLRLAYNLFTQKPKGEKDDFLRWTRSAKYQQGDDYLRLNGGGEMLVFSAADFEDFRVERPDMPPTMENELESVVRILAQNRWPFRLHATYDETISRALDVYEKVNREIPLDGLHWFFDHAETISDDNIARVAALGGGIAVQHRMAYQGEYFVERYGRERGRAHAADRQDAGDGRQGLGGNGCDARRILQPVGLPRLAGHGQDGRWPLPLPRAQSSRSRDGAADVDRERHVVLKRGGQEGTHRGRTAGRSRGARPRLLRLPGGGDQGHRLAHDGRRRPCRPWRRRFQEPCAAAARGHARLVAGAQLRRISRAGIGSHRRAE